MKRTGILVAVFFAVLALSPFAQVSIAERTRTKVLGEVLDYGVYEVNDHIEKVKRPNDLSGEVGYGYKDKTRLVQKTLQVQLKKGVVFGYTWKIRGLVPNVPNEVVYRIKHPKIVNTSGKQSEVEEEVIRFTTRDGTYQVTSVWSLSYDYELVPGEYTITILHRDMVVAEKTFVVVEK